MALYKFRIIIIIILIIIAGTLRQPAGTLTRSAGTEYRLVPAHFYHWSALIRSPYSGGSTTEATATAAPTSGRRNRQRQPQQQPRTTVAKCVS